VPGSCGKLLAQAQRKSQGGQFSARKFIKDRGPPNALRKGERRGTRPAGDRPWGHREGFFPANVANQGVENKKKPVFRGRVQKRQGGTPPPKNNFSFVEAGRKGGNRRSGGGKHGGLNCPGRASAETGFCKRGIRWRKDHRALLPFPHQNPPPKNICSEAIGRTPQRPPGPMLFSANGGG